LLPRTSSPTRSAEPEELGLSIDNAADAGDVTHLYCHPVTVDLSCPGCGQGCGQGCRVRDHVERRLTDLPIAGHPASCT